MTWAHLAIAAAFLFTLGAAVGSFLNVCVHRIPMGMSLLHPPSRCPGCGSAISARDNVPVLGWILLRGRCRRCRAPISARYPIVEAAAGLLLVASTLAAGPADATEDVPVRFLWALADGLARSAFLLTGALIAIDRGSVPRSVASIGLGVALVLGATAPGAADGSGLLDALLGAAFAGSIALALRVASDRHAPAHAMTGPGTAAFAATVGAFVGIAAIGPTLAVASAILLVGAAVAAIRGRRAAGIPVAMGRPCVAAALGLAGLVLMPAGPWLGLS